MHYAMKMAVGLHTFLSLDVDGGHWLDSHPCRFTPREITPYALVLHEYNCMWHLYVHKCHLICRSVSFNRHVRGLYVTLFLELSVGTGSSPAEQDSLWRHRVRRRFQGQARGSEGIHWPPVGARRRLCKRNSQVSTSVRTWTKYRLTSPCTLRVLIFGTAREGPN